MQRAVTRSRSRAGAGGGRAGVEPRTPRIVSDPGKRTLAHPFPAEFGGGRLAQDDGAGGAQAFGQRRVGGNGPRVGGMGAAAGGQARRVREVLDRHRHAVQRADGAAPGERRPGFPRRRAGGVGVQRGEGVETRFERLDAREDGVDDIDRRQFAVADQARQVDGGRVAEVGAVHG